MQKFDLNGKWIGYYELGPDYGAQLNGEKTFFSIVLTEQGGEFEGDSTEVDAWELKLKPA